MLQWNFASHTKKDPKWYVIALIAVLSLIVYGITQGLYMMSIVVFLFAGVYLLKENNSEPIMKVEVTDTGIQVHRTFYEFSKIASFSILYEESIARILRLSMKKGLSSMIDVPITSDINPVELKEYLIAHIPENTDQEFSSSDKIIKAMRL